MSEGTQDLIGKLLNDTVERDAIHIAVAPVVAARTLKPGSRIGLAEDGRADNLAEKDIGIVDPFLAAPVKPGDRFFMFLFPNTIRSLRHEWTHPAFRENDPARDKSRSEKWMRAWAMEHVSENYYGEGSLSENDAYAFAIRAGHDLHIGPYESARDTIDTEWWGHWEAITGERGQRGEYFSCSC
jgi:hypothetical protein